MIKTIVRVRSQNKVSYFALVTFNIYKFSVTEEFHMYMKLANHEWHSKKNRKHGQPSPLWKCLTTSVEEK